MAVLIQNTIVIDDARNVANVANVDATGKIATNGGLYEHGQAIVGGYTISGRNAISAGPITIQAGSTVTIGAGSRWTIL